MATWILGDIHGRFETLQALWKRLDFEPERDHLWLLGDLVNRGPRSLDVLRWARSQSERLAERLVVVLGNHDLHLLAIHDGVGTLRPKDGDLLQVLDAPDRDELLAWLRRGQILHRAMLPGGASEGGENRELVLVHAGLLPQWTTEHATGLARRLENRLAEPSSARVLLSKQPPESSEAFEEWLALEAFTRLRMLDTKGKPCDFKGHPDQGPKGCRPWFRIPERQTRSATVVFGHWAALGLCFEPGIVGLDSGCAWGNQLTAYRLDDERLVQQEVLEPSSRI